MRIGDSLVCLMLVSIHDNFNMIVSFTEKSRKIILLASKSTVLFLYLFWLQKLPTFNDNYKKKFRLDGVYKNKAFMHFHIHQ